MTKFNFKYVIVDQSGYKGSAYVTNNLEKALEKLNTIKNYYWFLYEVVTKQENRHKQCQALKKIYKYDEIDNKIYFMEFESVGLHLDWYLDGKEIIEI